MAHFQTVCLDCGLITTNPVAFRCDECSGLLGFRYDYDRVAWDDSFMQSMWRYWKLMPIANPEQEFTKGVGQTPLLKSNLYSERQVYMKDDTRNLTGSHKDRPLAVAINHAYSHGQNVSIVVSGGSTGISNAALAARAGMKSIVVMTESTPLERVYPVYALGSTVIQVKGELDSVIDAVIDVCMTQGLYLSATSRSSNPYQSEGMKTIAYEIVEDLGYAPDWMAVTVGGGGTIAGIWRGFKDLQAMGKITSLPKLLGIVPKDYNALEVAFERDIATWDAFMALPYHQLPPSILVKLAHAYPPDGLEALEAVRESQGCFMSVTDEEALSGLVRLARSDGLYVEPSTSACIPAMDALMTSGIIEKDDVVVALMCGSGYRENFVTLQKFKMERQTTTITKLPEVLAQAASPD